ncbi:restriction endonuclease subunit S [Vagococcus fluvialis]|uniref:restriction endonuclease subunit S n=1 Tax=Vagococcus fluvialis TaxID=2738 RepID=UPI001D0B1CFF|nr:restriction endonuclease subunit S [Vagococcus fluvialis]UDM73466.1 restriction endonuclease subunit S [Vagococcus fluvialis]
MENKNVPSIRFKGFIDDWEERKLKDIAQFNPKTVLPDEFEYVDLESVVGTEMISHRTESKDQAPSRAQRLAQKGDVFYQTVRPYQMNNYLYDLPYDNYVFSTGYAQMRPNIDSYFLLNSVQNKQFVQHVLDRSTGTSYPAINSSDLSNIEIHVPSKLSEQQKIGAFFQSIDDTIALHHRELELLKLTKKSFLQQLFPDSQQISPNIRFANYHEDWEQRKLGEVVKRVTRKNKNLESKRALTISAQYGLVDQQEYFKKQIASRDISNYYLVKNGEFAYNKSYSNGYPWGAIKRLDYYKNGVLSTLYIIFTPTNINSDFLVSYYDTTYWYKEISKRAAEGARNHGLLNIATEDFFETEIKQPLSKKEQIEIGSFFKDIDEIIMLQEKKLGNLIAMKKSFLQKMFI